MRKALQIIGIIALLLVMAGSASAAYTLDVKNGQPGEAGYYEGTVEVLMTVGTDTITFDLKTPTASEDPIATIKQILINVESSDIESVTDSNIYVAWVPSDDGSPGNAGFGTMLTAVDSEKVKDENPTGNWDTVRTITLNMRSGWSLTPNEQGRLAVVHVKELLSINGVSSCYVTNPKDIPVPEFPTVALPIAAILGLAFVFMRRKN